MVQVLDVNDSTQQILIKMSEGNPGALSVVFKILQEKDGDEAIPVLLNLDSMDIRGSRIWLGYKDYCNEDLDKFCQEAFNRSPEMINFINKEMGLFR